MDRYRAFVRSCRNWEEFSRARKIEVQRDLTIEEARLLCAGYNKNRSPAQIAAGTMMEFETQ